jgi:hypothetical protein
MFSIGLILSGVVITGLTPLHGGTLVTHLSYMQMYYILLMVLSS